MYYNINRGVYFGSKQNSKDELLNGYPNALIVLSNTKEAIQYSKNKNRRKQNG